MMRTTFLVLLCAQFAAAFVPLGHQGLALKVRSLGPALSKAPNVRLGRSLGLRAQLDGPESASTSSDGVGMAASDASSMRWASACSVGFDTMSEGAADAVERCKKDLSPGQDVDVALVFISSRYGEARGGSRPATSAEIKKVTDLVQKNLGAKHVIGMLGAGVIGSGDDGSPEEFENFKAVSVTAANLPGVDVKPFSIKVADLPGTDAKQEDWRKLIGVEESEDPPVLLLMSEPEFSRHGDLYKLLEGLDFAYAGSPKVGGIAAPSPVAAAQLPAIFGSAPGSVQDPGQGLVVGLALSGNIEAEPIVAQGCRPIGPLFEINKVSNNMVHEVMEVGGTGETMMSVEALKKAIETLSPDQAQLAQTALFVGVANNFKEEPESGDFLIRQVMGVSLKDGGLVVGDVLRPGQRMKFHLRDREAAVEDVEALMSNYKRKKLMEQLSGESSAPPAAGLVMFACVGRGRELFGEPNYDSRMAYISTGVPVAGVFCNGEIGPVGGETFLHGFTSVFTIMRPKSK